MHAAEGRVKLLLGSFEKAVRAIGIPSRIRGDVAFTSPLEDFKRAVSEAGLEDRVCYLSHTYEF